jgi:hypothetical protein
MLQRSDRPAKRRLTTVTLLVNLALRPGQLTLGRRRKQLAGPTQTVLILTSYVRDPAAPKGTGCCCSEAAAQVVGREGHRHRLPANRAPQRL